MAMYKSKSRTYPLGSGSHDSDIRNEEGNADPLVDFRLCLCQPVFCVSESRCWHVGVNEHVVILSLEIMVINMGSDVTKRMVRPSDYAKEKIVYITRSITARPLLMSRKWALTASKYSPSMVELLLATEVMLDVP